MGLSCKLIIAVSTSKCCGPFLLHRIVVKPPAFAWTFRYWRGLNCNGFHRSLPTRVARADGPRNQKRAVRHSDQLWAIVSFARWLSRLNARHVILLRGYAG